MIKMSTMELKIPPLLLTVLLAVMMAGINWFLPQARFVMPFADVAAVLFALAGVTVCGLGVLAFRRARTTVNPTRPEEASSLITGGIYRISRNPMYLGLLLSLVGWSFFLSNAAVWVGPVVFVPYINIFQIGPEERMLEQLFGEAYRTYQPRVRRWI